MPRRDKRADIVNAGVRIFSRKGFNHCSVEDILQEAHVARATFYSYFDSKKDLFVELIDTILNTMFDIVVKEIGELPNSLSELKDNVRGAVFELLRFFGENWDFAAIYIQEVMGLNPEIDLRVVEWQQRLAELVKILLNRGIEMGMFRPMDTEITAGLVAGAPQHLGLHLFMYGQDIDFDRVANAVSEYLIYGLSA